jgi:hypothetical protein
METTTLDTIARTLGTGITRRSALRGLFAGTAAAVAGGALLQPEETSARKRKKKGGKKGSTQPTTGQPQSGQPTTTPGLAEGARCSSDGQCTGSAHLICEIPYGAGNSDKACCRGVGATCGGNLHCCTGEAGGREFQCVNGTCQPYVEP